ncbi:MAG: transcription antitermination protein NusB [Flavobacteriales bacterium]|nr:transcription antitermination protein NusB [Flavobacteriales bacterium]MDW8409320.1 transcription antitermination protein NusB [Flavobacteriales bacterium]
MLNRHKLRIRVLQILYGLHLCGTEKPEIFCEKLHSCLTHLYDLYLLLLDLLGSVHHQAVLEREKAREKFFPDKFDLMPETAFTRNCILQKISNDPTLKKLIQSRGLSWHPHTELPGHLFAVIRENLAYREYLHADRNSGKQDKRILLQLLDEVFIPDPLLTSIIEERFLFGTEDREIAFGMLARTIENTPVNEGLRLIPELQEQDEDYRFAMRLGVTAIEKKDILEQYIVRSLKNWEPDRVAPLDMLLLRLGGAELHGLEEVPVKVTLNEYIELSKEYSTPKSANFLNGVLDTMARIMQKEGMINKSGKGLLDTADSIKSISKKTISS